MWYQFLQNVKGVTKGADQAKYLFLHNVENLELNDLVFYYIYICNNVIDMFN